MTCVNCGRPIRRDRSKDADPGRPWVHASRDRYCGTSDALWAEPEEKS